MHDESIYQNIFFRSAGNGKLIITIYILMSSVVDWGGGIELNELFATPREKYSGQLIAQA